MQEKSKKMFPERNFQMTIMFPERNFQMTIMFPERRFREQQVFLIHIIHFQTELSITFNFLKKSLIQVEKIKKRSYYIIERFKL